MKRQPLEALGLTPEQISAVLNMHHADMDKARAEHFRTHKATETRAAIARMFPCLHSFKSLRTVLDAVNSAYLDERRQGADVCNLVANSGADEEKEQEAGNEHGRD